jgi:formiminotetrahydrofolate cyclodeaminase
MSQLFTDEERAAFRQQMQHAKTPEERQAQKQARHAEMQKRAAEKGVTLPDHAGHAGGMHGGMHGGMNGGKHNH